MTSRKRISAPASTSLNKVQVLSELVIVIQSSRFPFTSMAKTQLVAQKNEPIFHSKPLQDNSEIQMAQRLVYQVFTEEMEWIPDQSNPSGIRFVDDQAGKLFLDDFDEVATWFGTFHRQQLIACWRFCKPRNDKFELEHYHPIPDFLKTSASLEVTRLVIHPRYRNRSRALLNLTQTTHQHLCNRFDYVFAAVEFPNPGNLYLKLGLKKVDARPFRYSPSDKNEVEMVFLDFKDRTTLASGYAGHRSSSIAKNVT